MGLTFGPGCKLKRKNDIHRCHERGSKLYSKNFLFLVLPNGGPNSRLAVAITKKIDKRAVVRNRIKRLIREAFRFNRARIRPSIDIVVVARREAVLCTLDAVERQLCGALSKAGMLEN